MKKIEVNPLSYSSIQKAIKDLEEYKKWVVRKATERTERLAMLGATVASLNFSRAIYNGINDVQLSVEQIENGYKIVASGQAVAFIEFGSGARYGGSYPAEETEVDPAITVPGSWSDDVGKGHWNSPNGWYLPKDKGGGHSYGNPPAMAMYYASKEIEDKIKNIAQEVFSGD